MSELVSIPISGGIDRSVAKVLGAPRVDRLERARFIQPGEVVRSPGYAYDNTYVSSFTFNSSRAIGYNPEFGAWTLVAGQVGSGQFGGKIFKKIPGNWYGSNTEVGRGWISPAEAPSRLSLGVLSSLYSSFFRTQMIPTEDPSLFLAVTSTGDIARVRNGRIEYTTTEANCILAAGYAFVDPTIGKVRTYNATTDQFSTALSSAFSSAIGVWGSPEFGRANQSGFMAALASNGDITVLRWASNTCTVVGTIPNTDLPTGNIAALIEITFVGNYLIRSVPVVPPGAATLYFRAYNATTLAAGPDHNPTSPAASPVGLDNFYTYYPDHVPMVVDLNNYIWFATPMAFTSGTPSDSDALVLGRIGFNPSTGGLSTFDFFANIPRHRAVCRLIPAPVNCEGCFVVTANHQGIVDSALNNATCIWYVPQPNATAMLVTTLCLGETLAPTDAPDHRFAAQAILGHIFNPEFEEPTEVIHIPQFSQQTGAIGTDGGDSLYKLEVATIGIGRSLKRSPQLIPTSGANTTALSPLNAYQQAGNIIASGAPFALNRTVDGVGFRFDPPRPIFSVTTSPSGSITAGDYLLLYVAVHRDSAGNVIRSAPSVPVAVTVSTGGSRIVLALEKTFPGMTGNDTNSYYYEYYRTTNGGSVFYCESNSLIRTFLEDNDLTLSAKRALYTTGSTGALSGQKPNYGIPPCRCIWKGKDRYIAGGLEQSKRYQMSKLLIEGEGVNFTHPSEPAWTGVIDEDVTAVAQLDDAWLIASRGGIWAVYGAGPDDTGQNGTFEPPRRISQNIGIHSWRSLCEIPEGMLFQAQSGQIYLIARGTLQIIWFSEKARDLLSDSTTGLSLSWITAVVQHETRDTIHFIRRTGPVIVYDKRVQAWALDSDGVSAGLIGAIDATAARVPPVAASYATNETETYPTVMLLSETNKITYEACADGNSFGSPAGASWTALLETNDIALWGMTGWGDAIKFNVLLSGDGTATSGNLSFSFWAERGGTVTEARQVPWAIQTTDAYEICQFEPNKRKCSSFRVRLEWTVETIAGMCLETNAKPNSERTVTGVRS